MTSMIESYRELVALTRLYLLDTYSFQDRIPTELSTYENYKSFALKNKPATIAPSSIEQKAPPPLPKKEVAPLPLQPLPQQTSEQKSSTIKSPVVPQGPEPVAEIKPQTVDVKEKKPSPSFELDPVKTVDALDISDVRVLIKEKFPQQQYIEEIPSDNEARRIHSAWELEKIMPEVLLLCFQESQKQRAFLNNLSKAIQSLGMQTALSPAIKCEQEGSWSPLLKSKGLRLVIASDYAIYTLPELMKHYRETQKKGGQYLGNVPLFLLSDLSFYLKEPSLKPSLWKALKEILLAPSSL